MHCNVMWVRKRTVTNLEHKPRTIEYNSAWSSESFTIALLLGMLEADDRELLQAHLSAVELKPHQSLQPANRKIRAIYFPESGLASVVAIGTSRERQTEVSIIGREGMTGSAVVMGLDRIPHDIMVQVGGIAQCISASDLSDCLLRVRRSD